MTEQSEKVKDEDAIHKEGTKNEALHHHKERYHESAKLGQSKEERFESDRHEQRKENLSKITNWVVLLMPLELSVMKLSTMKRIFTIM